MPSFILYRPQVQDHIEATTILKRGEGLFADAGHDRLRLEAVGVVDAVGVMGWALRKWVRSILLASLTRMRSASRGRRRPIRCSTEPQRRRPGGDARCVVPCGRLLRGNG